MEEIKINEEMNAQVEETASADKTWYYKEKNLFRERRHTISIHNGIFTHQTEINSRRLTMKQRDDIRIEEVCSVNSYYGRSRHLVLAILLAVIGGLNLIGGFAAIIAAIILEASIIPGLLSVAAALVYGLLSFLFFRWVRTSFYLTFDKAIPIGYKQRNYMAHGRPVLGRIIGRPYHVYCRRYWLKMPEAVGYSIVESIGELMINN